MLPCLKCGKSPTQVKITIGRTLPVKGFGCCGAYFLDGKDWTKYCVEASIEKKIEKINAPKKIFIVKNPKFSEKVDAVFSHWNSKSLRKHRDLNTKTCANAAKDILALLNGDHHTIGIEKAVLLKSILASIDVFEAMANDPKVKPYNPEVKRSLRKLSLEDFFYNERTGVSCFKSILDKGCKIEAQFDVFSYEVFQKVVKKAIILNGNKLTTSETNKLAKFCNTAKDFYDKNKINTQVSITGFIKRILVNVCNGRTAVPFNFLISEEIISRIRQVAIEEGFLLQVTNREEEVVYSSKKPKTTVEF